VRDAATFAALAPAADAIAVGTAFAEVIAANLDSNGHPSARLAGEVCDLGRRLAAAGAVKGRR
jgi:hypothetical protein